MHLLLFAADAGFLLDVDFLQWRQEVLGHSQNFQAVEDELVFSAGVGWLTKARLGHEAEC